MNVNDTLWTMMMRYPSLFQNTEAAFCHLFLITGGGYDWIDGELVDVCSDNLSFEPKWQEPYEDNDELSFWQVRVNNMLQFNIDNKEEVLEEGYRSHGFPDSKILGVCEYSKIFNLPDDIKDDWKQAADDMISHLKHTLYNRTKYSSDDAADFIANKLDFHRRYEIEN